MPTKVSTKGQVVAPTVSGAKLNLQPGDSLEAKLEGQRIVLTPRRARPRSAQIIQDPATGLPVLNAGPDVPQLTSAQVHELLAELP